MVDDQQSRRKKNGDGCSLSSLSGRSMREVNEPNRNINTSSPSATKAPEEDSHLQGIHQKEFCDNHS